MTKLGIISDTHGLLNETALAVKLFQEQNVQAVIHCGDIGSDAVARAFQTIPTHFVLGNVDGGDSESLRLAVEETGNHFHGWFGSIELAGKRIAFLHGNDANKFDQESANGNWDLLCYGHTHEPDMRMQGTTLLLNPGAFKQVPRATVAIVTFPELTVERFAIG